VAVAVAVAAAVVAAAAAAAAPRRSPHAPGLDNLKTKFSRSLTSWGGPLEGFKNPGDDEDLQQDKRKRHIMREFYDKMTKISNPDYSKDMNAYYFMGALIFDVFIQILLLDMSLAVRVTAAAALVVSIQIVVY